MKKAIEQIGDKNDGEGFLNDNSTHLLLGVGFVGKEIEKKTSTV